jgi:hypothetical protein
MTNINDKKIEHGIKRCKDVSEIWLQGGKAIGEILRPKKK